MVTFSVDVGPLNLRGIVEGYGLACINDNCRGKGAGEQVPVGCTLVESLVAIATLSYVEIAEQVRAASCDRWE